MACHKWSKQFFKYYSLFIEFPISCTALNSACALSKARFPFKRNHLRCVRCINENRKKRNCACVWMETEPNAEWLSSRRPALHQSIRCRQLTFCMAVPPQLRCFRHTRRKLLLPFLHLNWAPQPPPIASLRFPSPFHHRLLFSPFLFSSTPAAIGVWSKLGFQVGSGAPAAKAFWRILRS